MAEHTPLPWSKNSKGEIGPRFKTDDQSDGMLDPIAATFGPNMEADAAFIVKAVNNHDELVRLLNELHALVEGESPSLLREDERLDSAIHDCLWRAK